MPVFEPKTFTEFFERMTNRAVARTKLTDLESGGVLTTLLGAVARELDDISYQMTALQAIWDINTATGADLDARAQDCNPDELVRNGAIAASGTVVFGRTITVAPVTVPSATSVALVGGSPIYTTTSPVTLGIGVAQSSPVGVVCVIKGSTGNTEAADTSIPTGIGEIVVNVAGVETVYNDTACTGGQDVETDPEFRERITTYLRSLPRGTPDALKFAVLGLTVEGYGRISVVEVEELAIPNYGETIVWVDDGNGTTAVEDGTGLTTPETVISPATGGEIRLYLANPALVDSVAIVLKWFDYNDEKGAGSPLTYTLLQGVPTDAIADYDYQVNYATGKITLNPGATGIGTVGLPTAASSSFSVAGLQPNDIVTAVYGWYTGLIGEAQKVIDGVPLDRENYPGYRAAGTYVRVKAPAVYWQVIEATVVVESGFTASLVLAAASSAVESYINGLTINEDLVYSELVYAVQSISGVYDVTFTQPSQGTNPNIIIGAGELARTSTDYITISGA